MFEVSKLKNGKPAYLSPKQIVFGRVNLMDARRYLSSTDYQIVTRIFNEISSHKEKQLLNNFIEYVQMAMKILAHFDIVAPYHVFSGDKRFSDTADQNEERQKEPYRIKAKQYLLANGYKFKGDAIWDKMVAEFYNEFLR
jgi:hypothetical protein